jgi:hypothetical protein
MPSININARSTKISPDRTKIAMSHLYSPVIEVIETENLKKRTIIEEDLESKIKKEFRLDSYKNENLIEYYDFIDVSNDYIYVLFRNEKYSSKNRSCIIKKFTWNGVHVKDYLIGKDYDISKFFVDEERQVIIAQSYSLDAVFKFNFN